MLIYCRLCLNNNRPMINVLTSKLKYSNLDVIEFLYWIFDVEVDVNEPSSKLICQRCVEIIRNIGHYRDMFKKNQLILQEKIDELGSRSAKEDTGTTETRNVSNNSTDSIDNHIVDVPVEVFQTCMCPSLSTTTCRKFIKEKQCATKTGKTKNISIEVPPADIGEPLIPVHDVLPVEVCNYCNKSFKTKKLLFKHCKLQHQKMFNKEILNNIKKPKKCKGEKLTQMKMPKQEDITVQKNNEPPSNLSSGIRSKWDNITISIHKNKERNIFEIDYNNFPNLQFRKEQANEKIIHIPQQKQDRSKGANENPYGTTKDEAKVIKNIQIISASQSHPLQNLQTSKNISETEQHVQKCELREKCENNDSTTTESQISENNIQLNVEKKNNTDQNETEVATDKVNTEIKGNKHIYPLVPQTLQSLQKKRDLISKLQQLIKNNRLNQKPANNNFSNSEESSRNEILYPEPKSESNKNIEGTLDKITGGNINLETKDKKQIVVVYPSRRHNTGSFLMKNKAVLLNNFSTTKSQSSENNIQLNEKKNNTNQNETDMTADKVNSEKKGNKHIIYASVPQTLQSLQEKMDIIKKLQQRLQSDGLNQKPPNNNFSKSKEGSCSGNEILYPEQKSKPNKNMEQSLDTITGDNINLETKDKEQIVIVYPSLTHNPQSLLPKNKALLLNNSTTTESQSSENIQPNVEKKNNTDQNEPEMAADKVNSEIKGNKHIYPSVPQTLQSLQEKMDIIKKLQQRMQSDSLNQKPPNNNFSKSEENSGNEILYPEQKSEPNKNMEQSLETMTGGNINLETKDKEQIVIVYPSRTHNAQSLLTQNKALLLNNSTTTESQSSENIQPNVEKKNNTDQNEPEMAADKVNSEIKGNKHIYPSVPQTLQSLQEKMDIIKKLQQRMQSDSLNQKPPNNNFSKSEENSGNEILYPEQKSEPNKNMEQSLETMTGGNINLETKDKEQIVIVYPSRTHNAQSLLTQNKALLLNNSTTTESQSSENIQPNVEKKNNTDQNEPEMAADKVNSEIKGNKHIYPSVPQTLQSLQEKMDIISKLQQRMQSHRFNQKPANNNFLKSEESSGNEILYPEQKSEANKNMKQSLDAMTRGNINLETKDTEQIVIVYPSRTHNAQSLSTTNKAVLLNNSTTNESSENNIQLNVEKKNNTDQNETDMVADKVNSEIKGNKHIYPSVPQTLESLQQKIVIISKLQQLMQKDKLNQKPANNNFSNSEESNGNEMLYPEQISEPNKNSEQSLDKMTADDINLQRKDKKHVVVLHPSQTNNLQSLLLKKKAISSIQQYLQKVDSRFKNKSKNLVASNDFVIKGSVSLTEIDHEKNNIPSCLTKETKLSCDDNLQNHNLLECTEKSKCTTEHRKE